MAILGVFGGDGWFHVSGGTGMDMQGVRTLSMVKYRSIGSSSAGEEESQNKTSAMSSTQP